MSIPGITHVQLYFWIRICEIQHALEIETAYRIQQVTVKQQTIHHMHKYLLYGPAGAALPAAAGDGEGGGEGRGVGEEGGRSALGSDDLQGLVVQALESEKNRRCDVAASGVSAPTAKCWPARTPPS